MIRSNGDKEKGQNVSILLKVKVTYKNGQKRTVYMNAENAKAVVDYLSREDIPVPIEAVKVKRYDDVYRRLSGLAVVVDAGIKSLRRQNMHMRADGMDGTITDRNDRIIDDCVPIKHRIAAKAAEAKKDAEKIEEVRFSDDGLFTGVEDC